MNRLRRFLRAPLAGALLLAASLPVSGQEFVYASNQGDATVAVIDVETLDVVTTVDLKPFGFDENAKPHHIAVEPDGSYWYISLIGANRVLKLDRENWGELRSAYFEILQCFQDVNHR